MGVDETVVDRVLARAAATPRAPAISAWDGALTYAELADASAAIASLLPRGERIALWVDRGRLLPVYMLAAMRAGAVFAVIDPAQPDARIATALDVLRPRSIVHGSPARPVPPALEARVRPLDSVAREPTRPHAGDPAYVLFTSGTTGRPKAGLAPH